MQEIYSDNHTEQYFVRGCAHTPFCLWNSSVIGRCESVKHYLSYTQKNKGDLVYGVNFNWIWESSAPPGHTLQLTWLKLLWFIKYHIPSQTLHRSQASLMFDFEPWGSHVLSTGHTNHSVTNNLLPSETKKNGNQKIFPTKHLHPLLN